MSMSTFVRGIVPPDEEWKKMKAVYDTCVAANLEIPDEVDAFFDGEEPDASGVVIDLEEHCREWGGIESEGYEIDVKAIPKHVKTIRFYNSW